MSARQKLTDQDIADIRAWYAEQQRLRQQIKTREQIAAEKGCSVYTVDEIVRNPDYRNLLPRLRTAEQAFRVLQRAARLAAYRADKDQQPCFTCGNPYAERHHGDYGLPKEIIWLCRACHDAVHSNPNLVGLSLVE